MKNKRYSRLTNWGRERAVLQSRDTKTEMSSLSIRRLCLKKTMIGNHLACVKARSTVRVERKRWMGQHFSDGQNAPNADNRERAPQSARVPGLVILAGATKHEWGRR